MDRNLPDYTTHPANARDGGKTGRESRWVPYEELNYCYGLGSVDIGYEANNDERSFGLKVGFGYSFRNVFFSGLSLGMDKHEDGLVLPVTLHNRLTPATHKTKPELVADLGYALGLSDMSDGWIIHPGIGIKTPVKNSRTQFHLILGCKFMIVNTTYGDGNPLDPNHWSVKTDDITYKYLSLRAGVSF